MKPKTDTPKLPPFIFPGKSSSERKYISSLKRQKLIYAAGPRLYTSVSKDDLPTLIRGSWSSIVSALYTNVQISHRTALSYQPSTEGVIYLTSATNRIVHYPGLTICFLRGPKPLKEDEYFVAIRASCFTRALLENLSSRHHMKCISRSELETRLEELILQKGEKALKDVRDLAKKISVTLNMKAEFKRLDALIGALLGTKSNKVLKNRNTIARSLGQPYDQKCLNRLETTFAYLKHLAIKEYPDPGKTIDHFHYKAFFDAYFSNYIEGTIFELKDAERIIFSNQIPRARPIDAHDILGTYKLVSDPNEMGTTPTTAKELKNILKRRHSTLLQKRSGLRPGHFKKSVNRAGNSTFVHPDYVDGTLEQGFEFYQALPVGLARATYMMFFISEIHPFLDGNGRISRIMMNAELYSQGMATIIIPNVYREDYLSGLRAMTRRNDPSPMVRMLGTSHEFSALDFSNFVEIKKYIEGHNWFLEPNEGKLIKPKPADLPASF